MPAGSSSPSTRTTPRASPACCATGSATPADVVVSDDPTASKKIAEFAQNDRPWLVAVRMVSEGVDIPRLRVGVFATTTSTELFFRQAVGRFVRWQAGPAQPEGVRLHPRRPTTAHRMRSRSPRPAATCCARPARRRRRRLRASTVASRTRSHPDDAAEQLSLFSVVSSTATDITVHTVTEDGVRFEPLFELDECGRATTTNSRSPSPVRRRSAAQPRPARGADRGRARAVRLAQRRRTQGRPAHPQRRTSPSGWSTSPAGGTPRCRAR